MPLFSWALHRLACLYEPSASGLQKSYEQVPAVHWHSGTCAAVELFLVIVMSLVAGTIVVGMV